MWRIGFDAKRLFNNFTGLGNYSRTLLSNLSYYYPDDYAYFLYTPKITRNPETKHFLNSPLYSVIAPPQWRRPLWRSWRVRHDLHKHKIELYHGLSNELPLGLPGKKIRTVVTIHDLAFLHYPDYYPPIDREVYNLKFGYACRNADRIVAISEHTKQDIVNYYQIDPDRIAVIYQSCHERFMQEKSPKIIEGVLAKYNLPSEYFLYVGTISERKNLLGVIQGVEKLPPDLRLPLVVIGGADVTYRNQVEQYLQSSSLRDKIFFLKAESEDLPAIYQRASVFLYPSRYEGFGIPVLEALFSKTPVISSLVSSLPEAAGPGAWLVDPDDADQITTGIAKFLTDDAYRELAIDQGYDYAQRFRGEELTEQMIDLYLGLLER